MNNDYISRADLIKQRHGCKRDCGSCDFARDGDSWCEGELFITDVLAIPAADVRPVVLCRDCKWYKESELLTPNRFCFRLQDGDGNHIGYNFDDLDFCSYGERREDT